MDGSLEMELLVEALSDSDAKIQEPAAVLFFFGGGGRVFRVFSGFLGVYRVWFRISGLGFEVEACSFGV